LAAVIPAILVEEASPLTITPSSEIAAAPVTNISAPRPARRSSLALAASPFASKSAASPL